MGQLTKVSADLVKKVQRLPPSCLKRDWPFFCANFPKLCNCAKLYGSIDYKRKQYVKVYIHILGRTKYLKKKLKIFKKIGRFFFNFCCLLRIFELYVPRKSWMSRILKCRVQNSATYIPYFLK